MTKQNGSIAGKMTAKDSMTLIKLAIAANKKLNDKQLGIHSVYGGLLAVMQMKLGVDKKGAIELLDKHVEKGELKRRPVKGGFMYYLPEDFEKINTGSKANGLLAAMEAMK